MNMDHKLPEVPHMGLLHNFLSCTALPHFHITGDFVQREQRGKEAEAEADACFRTNAVLSPKLKLPSLDFGGKGKSGQRPPGGIEEKAWTASILSGKVADRSYPTGGQICSSTLPSPMYFQSKSMRCKIFFTLIFIQLE